jgi:tRNA G18 (ribose-2'-O)-methylase SpoU
MGEHSFMRIPLQSTDNPLVKELARLHDNRHRAAAETFLVEGRRAIDGCLQAGWTPRVLLVREDLGIPGIWPAVVTAQPNHDTLIYSEARCSRGVNGHKPRKFFRTYVKY